MRKIFKETGFDKAIEKNTLDGVEVLLETNLEEFRGNFKIDDKKGGKLYVGLIKDIKALLKVLADKEQKNLGEKSEITKRIFKMTQEIITNKEVVNSEEVKAIMLLAFFFLKGE